MSETIEVRALIDRFLEHGRVFHFANGGKDEVYIVERRLDAAQLPPPRRGA